MKKIESLDWGKLQVTNVKQIVGGYTHEGQATDCPGGGGDTADITVAENAQEEQEQGCKRGRDFECDDSCA